MRTAWLGIGMMVGLVNACSVEQMKSYFSGDKAVATTASLPRPVGTIEPPRATIQLPRAMPNRSLMPTFCQRDKSAGFENGGENYCAPTAVSDGLIYLALARDMKDLVAGADPLNHAKLIRQLASRMETDPDDGTPPGRIIEGLRGYVESRKYHMDRLEIAGWRSPGKDNLKYRVNKRPQLEWLEAAARDADAVTLFNIGWYKSDDEGFKRAGGHWLVGVGMGPGPLEFQVRNPALKASLQPTKTSVVLTKLTRDFALVNSTLAPNDLDGYYKVDGPGLPRPEDINAAVLDGAVVFRVKR